MKQHKRNSTCKFAEETVSYLYDEMSPSDKSLFENHLDDCSRCRNELAEFSFARESIQEWRTEEFETLANPTIEIHYSAPASLSWFIKVRDFLTISPAWMTATTAMATLAIILSLFLIMLDSMPNKDDVLVQDKSSETAGSPAIGNRSNPNPNNSTDAKSPTPENVHFDFTPIRAVIAPTKIGAKQPSENAKKSLIAITKRRVARKSNEKLSQPPRRRPLQKSSAFVDEDDDDNSITLLDLLDDIVTRERNDKK